MKTTGRMAQVWAGVFLVLLAALAAGPAAARVERYTLYSGDRTLDVVSHSARDGVVELEVTAVGIDLLAEIDGETLRLGDRTGGPAIEVRLSEVPATGGLGSAIVTAGNDTGRFELREDAPPVYAGGTLDCATLQGSALVRSLGKAAPIVLDQGRLVDPNLSLATLLPLGLLRSLPGCKAPDSSARSAARPNAGGCYYDTVTFSDCESCCRDYSMNFICPWLPVFRRACSVATSFVFTTCADNDCTGKPGDPECDATQDCAGDCLYFCGIGRGAACGTCDHHHKTACCN